MPTLKTPADIIDLAKLSQMYAANAKSRGDLFAAELSPKLFRILYVERKSLEWMYDLDPTNSTLQNVANYVYRLCGRFGLKAAGVLGGGPGGGTVITPITPGSMGISFEYLIPIRASDFFSATEYRDSRIAGKQVEVFWKNIPNYQSSFGWQLIYTPNGFEVFVDNGSGGNSFDAFGANADAEFEIYIVHPNGTVVQASSSPFTYTGTGLEGVSFSDSSLIGRTVKYVLRGTPYAVVASSPNAIQCTFDTTTGTVTFNAAAPILNGEFIVVPYT